MIVLYVIKLITRLDKEKKNKEINVRIYKSELFKNI